MKYRSRWSKEERERKGYKKALSWKRMFRASSTKVEMKVTLPSPPPWEIDNGRERSDGEVDREPERFEGSDKNDDKST
tara:strand:+ start:13 stop:246 length:234 start_codon:yes stop_codon:yes gene_type:complete